MEEGHPKRMIRVLVASTEASTRKLVLSSLTYDPRVEVVAQAADGDEVVSTHADFDAAIVDVAITGLGVFGVMSNLGGSLHKPMVMVVARTHAIYLRHACLAEGAADYLVLPDDLPELAGRLVNVVQDAATTLAPKL